MSSECYTRRLFLIFKVNVSIVPTKMSISSHNIMVFSRTNTDDAVNKYRLQICYAYIDLLWLKTMELKQNNYILHLLLYLQLKSIPSSKESRMHVIVVHKIKIWIAKNNLNTQKTPEIHDGKLFPESKEKSVKLLSTLKVRKLKFHEEHIL